MAGLSVGAYPAAVIAGALGFADALRLVDRRARRLGKLADPDKGFRVKIDHPLDQVIAAPGPGLADLFVAHMVGHGRGARRKDGHVRAALAQQAQLILLDAFADLVVGDLRIGRIDVPARFEGRLLQITPLVMGRRRGRIVAVAINDHRETPSSSCTAEAVLEMGM